MKRAKKAMGVSANRVRSKFADASMLLVSRSSTCFIRAKQHIDSSSDSTGALLSASVHLYEVCLISRVREAAVLCSIITAIHPQMKLAPKVMRLPCQAYSPA